MKLKSIYIFLLLLGNLCINNSFSQIDYNSNKEKIYIQTNHTFFKPGEQLFFKTYIVNAQDQTPSYLSKVVYVDVINPAGGLLEKLTFPITDGYAEGSFDFAEEAVGGMYKLKAYTNWMLNENDSTLFVKEITVQKTIAPRILMKLEFPQKGYGPDDKVIADYSIKNLNDEPIINYDIAYTVAIAGKVIETSKAKTDREGKAKINFELPKDLNSNDGLLNVTVEYDNYTEAISRSIPITLRNIDLQFMPEGGSLISNLNCNVAFKAINEFDKPVDIKGTLYNQAGEKIADIDSYKFGMGKFTLTPMFTMQYHLKITSPANIEKLYYLPAAQNGGIALDINQQQEKVIVGIKSTEDFDIILVGQSKSKVYYEKKMTIQKGDNSVEVETKDFPVGIAQFTIYSATNLPMAERLVFLNNHKNLQVSISTDKKQYLPREKVQLILNTTDDKGKPVPANFSLSVVDDKLWSFADDKQNHILSWLLLSSELKGKIEEPQFYFKKDEPKASAALDLLMLTHGYRYFDFIQYVKNEKKLKYFPEETNMINGIITNAKNEPVASLIYLIEAKDNGRVVSLQSNPNGEFSFKDLTAQQYYYLLSKPIDKKNSVQLKLLQNGIAQNTLSYNNYAVNNENENLPTIRKIAITKSNKQENNAIYRTGINATTMFADKSLGEEVVVVGYGAQSKKNITGSIATVRSAEINNFNKLEYALQGKVPGIMVTANANPGAAAAIQIRGVSSISNNNKPLLVVNGILTENFDVLQQMSPNEIDNVNALRDAAGTAIFGYRAANGVIIIETKKFRNAKQRFNLTKKSDYFSMGFTANGKIFSAVKKYYAPKYTTTETTERNDFRENIYWNPTVQTDKNGNATLEFYNSDATTTFRIITEGIGYNGVLGRAEKTYSAQKALSFDAKTPPYLTVGDKALVPLVLKNNTAYTQYISIGVQAPTNINIGSFVNSIQLSEGQSQEILIPIEATNKVQGNILFTIDNNNEEEKLSLPIVANGKGFPMYQTFSGDKSQEHIFNISNLLPGTIQTKLTLFKDIEGQLLDGISSMLREPYGCFEQTSSSTYPNVFILKYLKETGKLNPAIEKMAMGYIERGYKRLIGFETPENGFEWFGKAPAHEALTAYGLLEFTDMAAFIKVDKKMLARTRKFLLDKRNGKGGFSITSGGYDRFASVPNKIANIYIVYAMAQAGYGNDITLEYDSAYKKVITTDDGYQLAMMAIAAQNMKRTNDYTALINKLKELYNKKNFKAETSVVNSRDASLRVEALSLFAIALCKENNPNIPLIAELISKILAEKSYYGYGSTQATVLALNAVVHYNKLKNILTKENTPMFVLNTNSIIDTTMALGIKEGNNSFVTKYIENKTGVPYNLEINYQTLVPPNSEKAALKITTVVNNTSHKIGETVRMTIAVQNQENILQPMAIAKIGIPAGLTLQPWQLKEISETNKVAYYEIFDNYLVFYWMGFAPKETKTINIDLKADIQGTYKAKASNVYLYYTPEHQHWADGNSVIIGK